MRVIKEGPSDMGSKYVTVSQTKNQDMRRTALFWVLCSEYR
jgi:hypothetical protein